MELTKHNGTRTANAVKIEQSSGVKCNGKVFLIGIDIKIGTLSFVYKSIGAMIGNYVFERRQCLSFFELRIVFCTNRVCRSGRGRGKEK